MEERLLISKTKHLISDISKKEGSGILVSNLIKEVEVVLTEAQECIRPSIAACLSQMRGLMQVKSSYRATYTPIQ